MNARLPAFNNFCRLEGGKVLEPEACGLRFAMTILPRLNDLIRLPDLARYDADRVLKRNVAHRRIQKALDKLKRAGLSSVCYFCSKMPSAGNREIGAGGVEAGESPVIIQDFQQIALNVEWAAILSRENVA